MNYRISRRQIEKCAKEAINEFCKDNEGVKVEFSLGESVLNKPEEFCLRYRIMSETGKNITAFQNIRNGLIPCTCNKVDFDECRTCQTHIVDIYYHIVKTIKLQKMWGQCDIKEENVNEDKADIWSIKV